MSYLYDIFIYPIELIVEFIYARANRIFANPGLSIMAVSLVVNILVLPLYNKSDAMQEEERKRQTSMQRWSDHIKKTFSGDERIMMQAAYYRQQNYKPVYALRGSVSLLLQIPFFIAAYHFLSNLGGLKGVSFLMIPDLGRPDELIKIGKLSINLLPVLMTGINILSGALYTKGFSVKQKLQLYGMALIFLVLLYGCPSGLVLYWTLNNIFSLGKNIFLKLVPQTKKARGVCLSAVGIVGTVLLLLKTYEMTKLRLVIFLCLLIATQIPLVLAFLPEKKRTRDLRIPENGGLMVTSCLFLTVLMGGLISSAVVSSSPIEFMTGGNPLALVFRNFCIYAGLFMVWMLIFYWLQGEKARGAFAALMFAAGLIFVANFMFFGKNLGIMSNVFKFDRAPSYSVKEMLLSSLVSAALFAAAVLLAAKKPKLSRSVSLVMLIAVICMTVGNSVSIGKDVRDINVTDESAAAKAEGKIRLSRDGKNVVVLMLDRGISGFVPYIFEEKPELRDSFSGFTYYRNTLSFGGATNICAPALYGGYEYTPTAINERPDETLRDKHDEALLLMPTLFAGNGYQVSVFDPPYAGYKTPSDLHIFDGLENTDAYSIIRDDLDKSADSAYLESFLQYQKRSLVWYCVFKSVPVPFQNRIYFNGNYSYAKSLFSVSDEFMKNYMALDSLISITSVEDIDSGFMLMDNEITHSNALLELPDYVPSLKVTADPYSDTDLFDDIHMETERQISHYQVNMAAFLKLGAWFDYLKEQGVYDNTRIILASDHGIYLHSFDEYMFKDRTLDAQIYWSLLLVKDFDSQESSVSEEFMTIADVPTLAFEGLVDDPVNPFTGNPVNSDEKHTQPQLVTTSLNYDITAHNGYELDLSDGVWYSVQDDIFKEENWQIVSSEK